MERTEDLTARFLIIRLSSIGDIVLTTPVVRCLKQQVDHARVHYLVKEAFLPVVEANPHIDKIHVFRGNLGDTVRELRKEQFDYIIDLHHNLRSAIIKSRLRVMHFSFRKLNLRKWLLVRLKLNLMPSIHTVDRYLETLRLFDVENDGRGLEYFIPEKDRLSKENLPYDFRNGYVLVVIGAMHATKKLTFEQLVRIISRFELPVILAGGPAEKEEGDSLVASLPGLPVWNACGVYNISQSASLVEMARVVLTHDTGLMHVAAAFHKKTVSVWGNTVPEFGMTPYLPDPESRMFQVEGLRCRPCSKIGYRTCPRSHFRCMLQQNEDGMVKYIRKLFSDGEK